MKKELKNAVLYCRVNMKKPSDVFYTKVEQEHRLIKYCAETGYNIIKVFTDYNSPTNENNLQLESLIEFTKKNAESFDFIFCESFERFSRDFEQTLEILSNFCKMGVNVLSLKQIMNLKNKSNER
jgi:DNA invertase Pin-like site-specific DNA recombinase